VSLPFGQTPLAQHRADGSFFFYAFDAVGMPIAVFDEAGQLVLAVRTKAYGGGREERLMAKDIIEVPFGFTGQYRDDESGLHYNHHRYYDPRLGRFLSPDPLGLRAGTNLYAYPACPTAWIDPYGLIPFQCLSSWTPCQQRYSKEKVNRINSANEGRRNKRCTCCRKNAQRRDYMGKKCGFGKPGFGRAIDHMHELQAGGADRCCNNLRAVGKNYNNDLGKQTKQMLKKVMKGKVIPKITVKGCDEAGQCTDEEMNRVAKPPPINGPCKKKDDKALSCKC
jgi:RHS repeat-associated protein